MRRKIAVLINPVAGKGKAIETLPVIYEFFEPYKNEIELIVKVSKYKFDITRLTEDCIKKEIFDFIALGGDGTLFELVNGIPNDEDIISKVGVALLPLGSGNDFVKSFDKNSDIMEILKNVRDKKSTKVDCGIVNDHRFINSCTFGIDGPIIQKTDKLKNKMSGPMAYMIATLSTALHYKAPMMRIKIDDKIIEKETLLLAVGNGQYIGGGMKIFPESKFDDGLLDVCLVENVSKVKFMKEFKKIYEGRLNEIDEVHYFKAKSISIETLSNFALINADGNLIGTDPATIKLYNNKLNFYN